MERGDHSLERLLDLADEILVVAEGYWVRFKVTVVEKTADRPHGIKYSLTFHGPNNERIIGFDNAHPAQRDGPRDHEHRDGGAARSYEYTDAEALLQAFWVAVDGALEQRGLK